MTTESAPMYHMQTILQRHEIPLKRHLEQIALTLEMAGARDEISELRVQYAPGQFITWRKDADQLVGAP